MVPAVTLNVAEVAPAATATDAGVVSKELLSDSVTVVLAVAALLNVTVQVLAALEPRVVGVQASEDSVTAAARLMVAVFDTPLIAAVTTAD